MTWRPKIIVLRIANSRRLRETRPATFVDHWLKTGRAQRRRLGFSYRYARGLFEWTPFWAALLLNRQNRRPR